MNEMICGFPIMLYNSRSRRVDTKGREEEALTSHRGGSERRT